MDVEQTTFTGGANLLDIDTAIPDGQYKMLINGRQRKDGVLPIAKSVEQDGLPEGNYQGGIDVGNVAIVFVNGLAYYQVDGSAFWLQIASFYMDATAERLYAIAVQKSTQDYVRKRGSSMNSPIVLTTDFTVAGNPAGVLVQDGLNQAWLIQFNAVSQTFVARVTKNFSQWSNTSATANDREYVPIGLWMFTLNQKLFIVAPDRKSLYQSVTGRQLDFMVNIDVNGNKLATEAEGGAASVSFAFDSDEITCVKEINIPDSFIYGTARRVRAVTLDYTQTILGEPTYRRAIDVEAGVVNNESFLEVLGDYTFVDNDGVKSFNAVANLYVEGTNSNFSLGIAKLLDEIKQTATAAVKFDNYAMFYCKTTLGNAILVYDELRENWVSFDVTLVNQIKSFFVVATGLVNKLYAVCEDTLWQMYASENREVCQLHMRALTPTGGKTEHRGQLVKPIFRGCTVDGTLRVIEYADEQKSKTETRTLTESVMAMVWPLSFPMGFDSKPNMINNTLTFDKGLGGKKLAYVLVWDTDAALQSVSIVTSEQDGDAASRQLP